MAKARNELTKLEWTLMDTLWNAGQATASDLQKSLADSQGWAYSTVKTMLDRLVEMHFVKARRVGNVYEYSPRVKRAAAVRRAVDLVVERLFGGEIAPFVQQLLKSEDLNPDDIDELKSLLKEYDRRTARDEQ